MHLPGKLRNADSLLSGYFLRNEVSGGPRVGVQSIYQNFYCILDSMIWESFVYKRVRLTAMRLCHGWLTFHLGCPAWESFGETVVANGFSIADLPNRSIVKMSWNGNLCIHYGWLGFSLTASSDLLAWTYRSEGLYLDLIDFQLTKPKSCILFISVYICSTYILYAGADPEGFSGGQK